MRRDALTTFEIADFCQVTHRTVLQWITAGKLKAFRTPGNHSRVKISDCIEFMNKFGMPIPTALERFAQLKKKILLPKLKLFCNNM